MVSDGDTEAEPCDYRRRAGIVENTHQNDQRDQHGHVLVAKGKYSLDKSSRIFERSDRRSVASFGERNLSVHEMTNKVKNAQSNGSKSSARIIPRVSGELV